MLALALLLAALPEGVAWRTFDGAAFAEAKAARKLVILDLGTGWCHWCHVMDAETYGDPAVQAALAEGFVVTRADADARLDLAQRYEDYGWPATIVLDADGRELVKRKGYIRKDRMLAMLRAVRADPTPGPSVVEDVAPPERGGPRLSDAIRADLEARWQAAYEPEHAGWGRTHKYVHGPSMDLALERAAEGDAGAAAQAIATLEANARTLLDPVEGGVFQYSDRTLDDRPWATPHYEKIMAFQASNLRHYAQASSLFSRPDFAGHARDLARYLTTVLSSPDGAFYASQDADARPGVGGRDYYGLRDVAKRAALGAPRVDRATYARETGLAVAALAEASGHLRDDALLARAIRGAEWAMEHRRRGDGTYRHGDDDARYLGDTLAMAQAAIAVYLATADARWKLEAERAMDAIARDFQVESGGYASAPVPAGATGALARPVVSLDENVDLARLANLLAQIGGRASDRAVAEHAMTFLTSPATTGLRRFPSGILLADAEQRRAALHVTVVGARSDPAARALFAAARAWPSGYVHREWLSPPDRTSGAITFPALPYAAAYACTATGCSSPARDARALAHALRSAPRPTVR